MLFRSTRLGVRLGDWSQRLGYWLFENHPEFPQVQNGSCQYKLAEIHFAAREVREAIKQYQDLSQMHKDHPKVTDAGSTGVKRRLDECYKLSFKMGYARDRQK